MHVLIHLGGVFLIQFAYYSLKYSKCIPTKFPLLFICAKIEQGYKKGHYSPISTHPCQSAFSRSFTQCLILLNNIHLTLFTHTPFNVCWWPNFAIRWPTCFSFHIWLSFLDGISCNLLNAVIKHRRHAMHKFCCHRKLLLDARFCWFVSFGTSYMMYFVSKHKTMLMHKSVRKTVSLKTF